MEGFLSVQEGLVSYQFKVKGKREKFSGFFSGESIYAQKSTFCHRTVLDMNNKFLYHVQFSDFNLKIYGKINSI